MVDKKKVADKSDEKCTKGSNKFVEMEPKLNEATTGSTAVIGWGRMNPITSGHEILANKIKEIAKKKGGTPIIYLTHSQDAKKNPLSYNDKVRLARLAFGPIVQKSNSKTIIQAAAELTGKYDNLVLVAGADRVKEFQTILNKYNGKDFTFNSIEVVSAGERADPDSDAAKDLSAANMSASVMRKLAAEGNKTDFVKGLPAKLKPHANEVYDLVRGGMQIAEAIEQYYMLDEAVLTFAQRRKRALVMRRFKTRIAAARKRMAKRMPTMDRIKTIARRKAIQTMRKKLAGAAGANYAELAPSQKMMIDTKVQKKQKAIERIAKKLIPQVKKDAVKRVQMASNPNPTNTNESFELFLETCAPTKRFHEMRDKDGNMKYDRRFRAFRNTGNQGVPATPDEARTPSDTEILRKVDEAFALFEKDMAALAEKAELSGYPLDMVQEVFERGLQSWSEEDTSQTQQQWAFARVNSFINEGAAFDLDIDLINEATLSAPEKMLSAAIEAMRRRVISKGDKESIANSAFEIARSFNGIRPRELQAKYDEKYPEADTSKKDHSSLLKKYGSRLEEVEISETIKQEGSQWVLYSSDGSKKLGSFPSKEAAMKRERQIQYFKHVKEEKQASTDIKKGDWVLVTKKEHAQTSKYGGTTFTYNKNKLPASSEKMYVDKITKTKDGRKAHLRYDQGSMKGYGVMLDQLPDYMDVSVIKEEATDYERVRGLLPSSMDIGKWYKIQNGFEATVSARGAYTLRRKVKIAGEIKYEKYSLTKSGGLKSIGYSKLDESLGPNAVHETAMREENGAGEWGTDKLAKKYKDDTPGENVDEAFESMFSNSLDESFEMMLEDSQCALITQKDIKELEKFADELLKTYGLDIEFTKHFGERMSDDRNNPCITVGELKAFFRKIYANKAAKIKGNVGIEAVLKDVQKKLNMPVIIARDKSGEVDVKFKTIMRKQNFTSPNRKIEF